LRFDYPELLGDGKVYEKTVKALDKIANELSEIGLEVHRNPMPLTWMDLVNEENKPERRWVFAAYNNCIVQFVGEGENENYVILPRYSGDYSLETTGFNDTNGKEFYGGDWSFLEKYESIIKAKWIELGFKPIFSTNCLPLSVTRGGLRCIVKVLEREFNNK